MLTHFTVQMAKKVARWDAMDHHRTIRAPVWGVDDEFAEPAADDVEDPTNDTDVEGEREGDWGDILMSGEI